MLIDTSAWIEFLRKTGSPAHLAVRSAVLNDDRIYTTDAVRLELLIGATNDKPAALAALLDGFRELTQEPLTDVEEAARIFRLCRRGGQNIRSANDCLIAAIAIRHDVPVLHCDKDFETIAHFTELRVLTS
ncbi:MAG: PilT protein domain protein [Frankiales bacterium]|nr:PilT protein domain protein [Frankiales bacterium]